MSDSQSRSPGRPGPATGHRSFVVDSRDCAPTDKISPRVYDAVSGRVSVPLVVSLAYLRPHVDDCGGDVPAFLIDVGDEIT